MKNTILFTLMCLVYTVQCSDDSFSHEQYLYIHIILQSVTCVLQILEILVIIGVAYIKHRHK
ncbi:ORF142 [Betabaculovirus altermyunipunctae]|uniref:ORF142 n=1 Tax=Betabaculovirus altermyunipunctae TaxID=3051996 RepID=A0A1S5YEE5_9BBAC|nr:ORF142 [Betabaculovirus altermyunipunctae]AQQ80408.1 ORF142 [Betabaculovirus altermyunipunctae]